jgi:fatty acid desaturase
MTLTASPAAPQPDSPFPGSPRLGGLSTASGESWEAFRVSLTPNWRIVRRDIAICYGGIGAGLLAQAAVAAGAGNWIGLLVAPLAAAWIGWWIHSLSCFLHEAAHFNLHPDKVRNDQLANRLLCSFVGEEIARYRAVHWRHHLHLGNPDDTEVSYHHAPTPRFLLESVTGLHVLRVLRTRRRMIGQPLARASSAANEAGAWPLLRAALMHGSVLLLALLAGLWSTALTWCIAVAMVYPFLSTLRQLLEHRAADAPLGADFTQTVHGPINRLFGNDVLSRWFGAAGFNRHLLHHWHPATSYTRFDDLEAFLAQTPLRSEMAAARVTYWMIWRSLADAARTPRPA